MSAASHSLTTASASREGAGSNSSSAAVAATSNNTTGSSVSVGIGGGPTMRDDVYCHLVARRSVARAALHLGVERMTAESIDTLAGCLLEYLQRLGAATAATAEAAGRSSAHCNVLDILAATELCTTPMVATAASAHSHETATAGATAAASKMANESDSNAAASVVEDAEDDDADHAMEGHMRPASWKDLALFCFGPNWNRRRRRRRFENTASSSAGTFRATAEEMEANGTMSVPSIQSAGGKVGPSTSTANENSNTVGTGGSSSIANNALLATDSSPETGWNAPFPDEIPHFPVCSSQNRVANPHVFESSKEMSFHRLDTTVDVSAAEGAVGDPEDLGTDALSNIPDSAFQSSDWGSYPATTRPLDGLEETPLADENKRKMDANDNTVDEDERPAKKARFTEEGLSTAESAMHRLSKRRPSLPMYVPTFYPPFPVHQDGRVAVVEENSVPSSLSESMIPSSSLQSAGTEDTVDLSRSVRSALVSTFKNTNASSYWGSSWATTKTKGESIHVPAGRPSAMEAASASIVPITRASGSRVSRILEGSMDPAVL